MQLTYVGSADRRVITTTDLESLTNDVVWDADNPTQVVTAEAGEYLMDTYPKDFVEEGVNPQQMTLDQEGDDGDDDGDDE